MTLINPLKYPSKGYIKGFMKIKYPLINPHKTVDERHKPLQKLKNGL
jgi:hypothetical protein